jgi:hypothetical protein
MPHIHYIRDDYNKAYRVWDSSNPGDMFHMVPIADFPLAFVKTLPATFIPGFPDDDDGTVSCKRCLQEQNAPSRIQRRRFRKSVGAEANFIPMKVIRVGKAIEPTTIPFAPSITSTRPILKED